MASYVQLPNEHYKKRFELREEIQHAWILLKMINRRGCILTEPSILHKIWMGKQKEKAIQGEGMV